MPKAISTSDIPRRIGKVGARNLSPRRQIIKAPYLNDIQENHIRLLSPRALIIILLLNFKLNSKKT